MENELLNEEYTQELEVNSEAEYEDEAARRARREERRARMQKSKRRQATWRKISIFVIPAGALLLLGIVLLGLWIGTRNADDLHNQKEIVEKTGDVESTEEKDDDAGIPSRPIAEALDSDNGEDEPAKTENAEEESGLNHNNSDYGPYAHVYSEEKDIFFDGYEVKPNPNPPCPAEDEVYSDYALLVDAETGEIIAGKGGDTRINPASMTKILTVLVAAEHVTNLDDTFRIDPAINEFVYVHDCSAVCFANDEIVTVRDLLYGTILPSGADAALALAEYVAGSEELFVDMMNDKLAELGLSDTAHFTNCIGIYDENHYCNLSDMAMIMKAAVENELAREILREHKYTTTQTPEHKDGIQISNWFLRRIEDKDTHGEVVCAKTGFVNESGCCAASYEISNSGGYYICVTAGAWSSWRCIYDHVAMYDAYVE